MNKHDEPAADHTAMEERRVCDFLRSHGIPFRKPNPHQVKVGQWSFYPAKGTILCDDRKKEKATGAGPFIAILKRAYPDCKDTGVFHVDL